MFARASHVVEAHDNLGDASHVSDVEADARNEFTGMPLHRGGDTERLGPSSRLIAVVGVRTPDTVQRTANLTRQQIANCLLQDVVLRPPDGVIDPLGTKILSETWIGKARVGAEIDAPHLAFVARHDRLQDAFPAISAVDIVGPPRAALQIAELVEDKQRMIAGAIVVAIPDDVFLLVMCRADA